jgi:hypothetical protein
MLDSRTRSPYLGRVLRWSLSGPRCVARLAPPALALTAALALGPGPALAAKTDVVILRNGDRITGEVKGLASGKLDYSTDDAGRLSIEWDKVARLTSPQQFQLELDSGIKYFGRLGVTNRDGVLAVVHGGVDTLGIGRVVEISPINAGFLQRVQSYLDVGFTLAKANQATTFSLSGALDYRGPAIGAQLKFDSYAQGQESVPTTTRNSARQAVSWYLPHRWSAVALAQIEQNEELDLDHRLTGGGAMNRVLGRSNHMELTSGAGLVGTQERFSSAAGSTSNTSLEGLLAASWSAFRFDSPKLDFSSSLALFPSLSQAGRVRGQVEVRLKYELFKDFNAGILLSDTFDSRPPDENTTKNDYVTTLTIGWSYRR